MKYPFRPEEELKDVGFFPAVPGPYGMPTRPARKFNTPITPMENFQRIKEGKKPLWMMNVPTDFNVIQPDVMPDAHARNYGGTDWFGIQWQYEPMSRAAMVKPGTRRLSDITNWEQEIVWPDLNAIDWKADYEKTYAPVISPDRPTMFVIVNGFFERLADLTSFVDTFCYLLEEQEAVEAFYTRLTDFHIDLIRIAREVYHADIITFHDDMGTQINSFMSPETFREVLLPHYQRMNKAAHEMGLLMNFHSCGSVSNQIPNFIDAGFDYWEGQDACNDKAAIMEAYGDRLGQVSIFMPSPELSDEEFTQAITNQVQTLGAKGKYITWFGNMKPGRSVNGEELIYSLSRQMYQE